MYSARKILVASLVGIAVLVGLLLWNPAPRMTVAASKPLVVYCAAGLKAPVEAIAKAYEQRYGIQVQLQFGGSGALLSNLKVARTGDLFIAADDSFLQIARSNQLVAESIPLAHMVPVIAVRRDAASKPKSLEDLQSGRWTLGMASPEAAAVGRVCKQSLQKLGRWESLQSHIKVYKPTVNDIASDIKLGTVAAGFMWDATANQYPELEAIAVPEWAALESTVSVGVLSFCAQPTAALKFARFMGAPETGLPPFTHAGFKVVRGDAWMEVPELLLFSGGVNRVAIEPTLRAFEEREGVKVTRVYNGCGILTAQIRSGQRPDAYFACDVSFMRTVSDFFQTADEISETGIVILTQKGNPKGIQDLKGLAAAGLLVGVANEQQSALGSMTARMLRDQGVFEPVMANVRVQTPTADLLVNQIRTGSLDAVVVFMANASGVRDILDVVPLQGPGSLAVQPFAIGRQSAQAQLAGRLQAALRAAPSRAQFEHSGFQWRNPGATP